MKISIRNRSKKKRSKAAMQELKEFAQAVAIKFGIHHKIKQINLTYKSNWANYYPKGKPLGGFKKLYHNGILTIDFTKYWDYSQKSRKEAIIHEMTHAKQIIEKRLVISRNQKELTWNGKPHVKWKNFRFKQYDSLSVRKRTEYREALLPWEREVGRNLKKYRVRSSI